MPFCNVTHTHKTASLSCVTKAGLCNKGSQRQNLFYFTCQNNIVKFLFLIFSCISAQNHENFMVLSFQLCTRLSIIMLINRLTLVITILLVYLVPFTAAECSAMADRQYCTWNQVYTYFGEIEMADWVSINSSSLCGSCAQGMFYSPLCGSPNHERWDGGGSCWPGTYSLGGVRQRCIPCTEGTFSSEFQSTACTLCPFGTFGPATGLSQCVNCPTGTFYNGTGALDSSVCQGPNLRSFVETMARFIPIGHGS